MAADLKAVVNTNDVRQQAAEELREELHKKAVVRIKAIMRQIADAQKVVSNLEAELEVALRDVSTQ